MNKTRLIPLLLCAAALTGCGGSTNESSLKIEVQTGTTAAAVVSTSAAETTASTAASSTAAATQISSITQQTTSVSESVTTTSVSAQTTVSETETTQQTTAETTIRTTQTTETSAETTTVKTTTAPPETTTSAAAKLRLFADLSIGDDCTEYVKQNKYESMDEDTSCHGEGVDREYHYSNYTLYTFFNGKKDKVFEIAVTGSGIKVEDALEVGMKKADVIAKIGEGEDDNYHRSKYDLSILYNDDDTVFEISMIDPEA